MNNTNPLSPSLAEIEHERNRLEYADRFRATLRSTLFGLVILAAVAILVATLWVPIYRSYGTAMAPTIEDGQLVATLKTTRAKPGNLVVLYHNNKLLLRRVVAQGGDTVDITQDGTVIVNGETLDEPYLSVKALGNGDIEYPCQVPNDTFFVLGDRRDDAVDSRYAAVGCVSREQLAGRVLMRIWPLDKLEVF